MLKNLLTKRSIEEQYKTASPELRKVLKKEYEGVSRNLSAKFLAPMSILPNKQVTTPVGTGKYIAPPQLKFGPKRKFFITD
jgi:hypothetical protein